MRAGCGIDEADDLVSTIGGEVLRGLSLRGETTREDRLLIGLILGTWH